MEQVTDPPPPFILVAGAEKEGWHRGIVGIVASRLKDEFNRPCAVVSIQGEEAVGSMRSIDGVHAVNCLESAKEYLIRFGGHPKAAGFSVKADNLNKLSEQLQTYVTQHTSSNDFIQKYRYDAEISHHSLNNKTRLELLKLGPFGMGNPQPRLLIRGVNVEQLEIKGATGSLVKFHIRTPDQPRVEAIWWGKKEYADELLKGPVDLLGSLQVNRWRGRETLQIKIEDVRHS
jgi:single-stranded-DNA-specific exonuclease